MLQAWLDVQARSYLDIGPPYDIDFSHPKGEPALFASDSLSWRIFSNPVTLFIGGVTAVILELALPEVREGVWRHSTFQSDPLRRIKRTGLAALTTVYAARSVAEPIIAPCQSNA